MWKSVRVLICGDRNYNQKAPIKTYLDGLYAQFGKDLVIIEGGAKGADKIAAEWCGDKDVEHLQFPADWDAHGKSAGSIRNKQMLKEGKPDLVIAFKDRFDWFFGTGGTENMIEIATKAGVPAYVMSKNTYKV